MSEQYKNDAYAAFLEFIEKYSMMDLFSCVCKWYREEKYAHLTWTIKPLSPTIATIDMPEDN